MPLPVPRLIGAHEAFCTYLEKYQLWGLYMSFCERHGEVPPEISWQEMQRAANFLVLPHDSEMASPEAMTHVQCLLDGSGYFVFATRQEMEQAFWSCVGDDGPTHLNPSGSEHFTCYALTFGPYRGVYQMLNENT